MFVGCVRYKIEFSQNKYELSLPILNYFKKMYLSSCKIYKQSVI
jgi:hypothetical protein